MSEQFGSVTRKKSSDFHSRIQFQSRLTIRWELTDKNFLFLIDIICLDDSVKYRIMAIKTNENFIPFSNFNSVTFRKPPGDWLVNHFWIDTRLLSVKVKCPYSEVASHDQKPDRGIVSGIKSPPLARTPPPTGFTLIGALSFPTSKNLEKVFKNIF